MAITLVLVSVFKDDIYKCPLPNFYTLFTIRPITKIAHVVSSDSQILDMSEITCKYMCEKRKTYNV